VVRDATIAVADGHSAVLVASSAVDFVTIAGRFVAMVPAVGHVDGRGVFVVVRDVSVEVRDVSVAAVDVTIEGRSVDPVVGERDIAGRPVNIAVLSVVCEDGGLAAPAALAISESVPFSE
jgi:hypothetical protein